ncbi:Benzylsuccinate synthase alpha subunit [Salinivirga cyanobacteriivorans]|uniref:Benzylsuccinate synthase alpha subunit n=1 Tax=Salinivirga cyanobacteriivorans TaxID=1307839 RepID=A0A0S2HX23_9BACT|nr:trans-4-hydroxy-L-proline dehydratase [Salinivirga cyanobacteriivorans]ALO14625.1 Benzylsuccinate synthase alpha subunit [Salinivirga cyanobacteriivorans]
MTPRISELRTQSLEAENRLSGERAQLITRFYKEMEGIDLPAPIKRARAFKYLLTHKAICINENELIVGERGPAPKATPTYPEVSLHSLQDLDILHNRPKVGFTIDAETRELYENEIIPYWKGRSMRDKIFGRLPENWHSAYEAGIFTEFQEQRAPGHTVAGKKIFQKGLLELKEEIAETLDQLDIKGNPADIHKKHELEAMNIAADAIIMYAHRHATKIEELITTTHDENRKKELRHMADICRKVPANAPETFHEMLQHYWFIHLGVITEVNPWDSFNPGRLDQHLYPLYQQEISNQTLTDSDAKELLEAFWVKFNNHPSPPKMGVTAEESNTYTDFALINLGGLKPNGTDAVNELSYLMLDVIEEMRILQPSSMVQVSKKNPDKFIHRALHISKTGFGQPSIFNTDAIIKELLNQGKDIVDARNGGASGCVETGAFGTESYILTGYFNLNKILEVTLHNGIDPRTGKKIGIETGNPTQFDSMDQLMEAYKKQLEFFANVKIEGNLIFEKAYAEELSVPFLSLIIEDCISNGTDYNAGGARYNTSYVQGVGLGSITDNLASINHNVFSEKNIGMKELIKAIDSNFEGFEELRYQFIYETPKYGNDDDQADQFTTQVFEMFHDAINGRPTHRGGVFRINMLPTTSHVYFGSVIGAMPDGRKAGEPLSEGISPVQGADKKGPTAVLKSAAKIDHIKTGGTLLNQKFAPSFFKDETSIAKLGYLIRSYFRMDGHHIQFNVVSADTLREAQKHPEKYTDLIVRVAGYSDYFNDLGEALQNEIIRRTAHEEA